MKHLIFLLSMIFPFIANGESYFRNGMKWDVQYSGTTSPTVVHTDMSYSLEGDTIIEDILAYKMYEITNHNERTKNLITAIYEKEDKVWFRYFPEDKWYLMYDFNLKPGDGCVVYNVSKGMSKDKPPYSSYLLCVQDQDTDSYIGHIAMHLKEYLLGENIPDKYYEEDCDYLIAEGIWLKGIGSVCGILENNRFDLVGLRGDLIEATIDGNILYKIGQSGVNDIDLVPIKISVDQNGLIISNIEKAATLTIHNAEGALIGSYHLTGNIVSIPLPHTGVYLITAGNYTTKIRF